MERNLNPNNLPVELNRISLYQGLLFVFTCGILFTNYFFNRSGEFEMSGKKSGLPGKRIPDHLPDGSPAIKWETSRTTDSAPPRSVAYSDEMADGRL